MEGAWRHLWFACKLRLQERHFQLIQHYILMQTTEIPAEGFFTHLERLRQTWANKFDGQFDSIILVNGKASAANEKSVAIVSWLFCAYNLTDTIISFSPTETIIFTSARKINFLNSIKNHPNVEKMKLKFVPKEDNNEASFDKMWSDLHGAKANPKVGMIVKDAKTGPVAEEYQKFIQQKAHTPVDASHFFNECFSKKDNEQIENIKKSSLISTYFLGKFIKEIQKVIDDDKTVHHNDLTKMMQQFLSNEAELKKCSLKLTASNSGVSIFKEFIDVGPVINVQSGGQYSASLFAEANSEVLKSDCIVLGLGTLYKSFNSYVSRTLLIDPTQEQKSTYKKIIALCKVIQQNLKPGIALELIYEKATQFMKQHLPIIEPPKSFGFGIGVFLVEHLLQITEGNKRVIEAGNSFLISLNFPNISYETKKGTKKFCVQIVDTVVVTDKGQQILTVSASNNLSDISYQLGEEDDAKRQRRNTDIIPASQGGRRSTRGGPKAEAAAVKLNNQKKRMQHQLELKKKKLEQLKQRVNQNFIGGFKKQKNIECAKLECYKSREQLPKQMKKNQIYLDSKNNTILLPINGRHVPFHVHTLKSVVKNDEGKYASLRFNFHLPGSIANLTFPKFSELCVYVKQMVFRSQQVARITDLEKQIKNLMKKVKLDLSQKHAKEDIVEQESLKLNKGKKPILRDLFARPGVGQKKVKGVLQCHLNGFRYSTSKGENIDVAFSNIKYAFFQPCQRQIIAAIHFRLHEPILIGKKKSEDVQFYSEGGPNAEDVGGRGRGGYGGEDEDDEERQKQARKKLDRQFKAWMQSCQEFIGKYFKFEIPNREAGFYGNPFNNNSLLQPTKSCLINITENRFFIVPIDQIQIACFERMYSNVKSFDMIFVMKDYENFTKVSSIPIKDVEKVKDWLDSCNIIFYDQGKNLNWIKFLGIIRKDFKQFVDDKAWMAWDEADQEDEEQEQDNDESFEASESDFEQESDGSESSSGYEDQNDSDSSGSDDEDLSEEGLSSDEQDERAEMEDRERDRKEMERQRMREKEKNNTKVPPRKK